MGLIFTESVSNSRPMKTLIKVIATLSALLLTSCAAKRTPFSPDGPPTVGMPAELSDRERLFVADIDNALRREGLLPVANGRGDMQLDFNIAEGPINTDTSISLNEGRQILASGKARAAGAPMIGRQGVAGRSFDRAFAEFQGALSRVASGRGWNSATSSFGGGADPLPIY